MKTSVEVTYEGRPLAELQRLIALRQKWLGESAKDATIATAIKVITSLRAGTKQARKRAKNSDIKVEDTGWSAGWITEGKVTRRCVRTSSAPGAHRVPNVWPVNLAGVTYVPGEKIRCYKITPAHPKTWKWDENRNGARRCWYVLARSKKDAINYGKARITRYLRRWRGLAKTALGFAMAKLSTRSEELDDLVSAKARLAAGLNARVAVRSARDSQSVFVCDSLRYAKKALKARSGAVELAMKKAANQISGYIWWLAGHKLTKRLATPFPEVAGRR